MAKSPSVTIREVDKSTYAVTSSDTVLAIVGYGTKGPINEAQVITSRNEFIQTYGPLPESSPWGHLAAYRAFNQTNQIIYYRVADTSGDNEAIAAERGITNAHPALSGYQEFSQTVPVAYGSFTGGEVYDFQLAVDGGSPRDVFIASPSNGDWTLTNIAESINTQITSDTAGFQEFEASSMPVISGLNRDYRFKVSVDSTDGLSSGDFSVILNPGDELSDLVSKVDTVLLTGSRGYAYWDSSSAISLTSSTGLVSSTSYSFNIDVDDAGSPADITITASDNMTFGELISAINEEFLEESVSAYAYFDDADDRIRVQSLTEGASSAIDLVDDLIATGGNPLFETINGGATSFTTVDGQDTALIDEDYTVAINTITGRIRIISGTTGTSSTVAITAPTAGDSLLTFLTSVLDANDGQISVGATCEVNNSNIRISSDTTGTASSIAIAAATGGSADNEDLVALLGTESASEGEDPVYESATDNILFSAKEKGSATNNISIVKSSRISPVDDSTIHTIEVYYGEDLMETFDDVSLLEADSNFFVTVINKDPANGGSDWVTIDYEDNDDDGDLDFVNGTYLLGTIQDEDLDIEYSDGDSIGEYSYKTGTDGIPSDGGAALFVNALASSGDLGNTEVFNYHILITPDNGSEATQNAAITLASYRKDFLYIADPPTGLEYDEVTDWHNGKGSHGRNSALNTSYAATYWPWIKTYDGTLGEYIWCPPSVFIGEKLIEIDNRYAPWFAPAGDTRGRIVASDIEFSPSFAQREVLYGDLNAVNPIVEFAAKGIEIYGQKTLYRANSAINRINVRRTLIYIKKLIKNAMEGIVFEPHVATSWNKASNMIGSILEPIRQDGGISEYQIRIDSTTNTEDLISQGIMKGVITIVPVGTIERIELSLKFLNPGATIE
jgi:uncharacterized protein